MAVQPSSRSDSVFVSPASPPNPSSPTGTPSESKGAGAFRTAPIPTGAAIPAAIMDQPAPSPPPTHAASQEDSISDMFSNANKLIKASKESCEGLGKKVNAQLEETINNLKKNSEDFHKATSDTDRKSILENTKQQFEDDTEKLFELCGKKFEKRDSLLTQMEKISQKLINLTAFLAAIFALLFVTGTQEEAAQGLLGAVAGMYVLSEGVRGFIAHHNETQQKAQKGFSEMQDNFNKAYEQLDNMLKKQMELQNHQLNRAAQFDPPHQSSGHPAAIVGNPTETSSPTQPAGNPGNSNNPDRLPGGHQVTATVEPLEPEDSARS